jgi:uncharacterized protein
MRFLLLLLLAGYVLWRWRQGQDARKASSAPSQPAQQTQTIDMVACAQCGVHLPVSQARSARSAYFCSAAHQKAHGA